MGTTRYDTWAMRLNEAIRSRQGPRGVYPSTLATATTRELLLAFGEEAAAIVGAIGRNIDAVQVDGNQRLASLSGILDALLPHRAVCAHWSVPPPVCLPGTYTRRFRPYE